MNRSKKYFISFHGPLAQLVEQAAHNRSVTGSSPVGSIFLSVAQLEEQWSSKPFVVGSNPIRQVHKDGMY